MGPIKLKIEKTNRKIRTYEYGKEHL